MSKKSYSQLSNRRKQIYLKSIFHQEEGNISNNAMRLISESETLELSVQVSDIQQNSTSSDQDHNLSNVNGDYSEVQNGNEISHQTNDENNHLEYIDDNSEMQEEENGHQEADNHSDNGSDYDVEMQEEQNSEGEETEDSLEDEDAYIEEYGEDEEENDDEAERINHQNIFDPDDPPLYIGAPLKVSESMLLILNIYLKYNIQQTCLAEIIEVINLHCVDENLKRNSLHKFKRYFPAMNDLTATKKHYYCESCLRDLPSAQVVCTECSRNERSKVAYFVEMSLTNQLQELFGRSNFYNKVQHRFQRQNVRPNTISDLYDGILYQQLYNNNGFLSNPNNISFTWYTDGVPVFKSSKVSMWPLYLTINELSYEERSRQENLLLAGLWFGPQKPAANKFVHKLYNQFRDLRNGHNFILSDERIINLKAILLMGTCDLVAKGQFLNLKQFNGAFGCPTCKSEGESFALLSGGSTYVYPYEDNPELRTSAETTNYAEIALELGVPIMGVKGPCIFSRLMPDFIVGSAIDRMHCIDGGVVQKLLTLWFDGKYTDFPFSLCPVINVINDRLITIKPPKIIHRMPRSIQDVLHWKASELKIWFFYYSLPILQGVMRDDYFQHYLLLVAGVSFLSADNITDDIYDAAVNFTRKFVREFETLYGRQFCSINIHQILHLPQCVKNLGPLWAYMCYSFEDLNGRLLSVIHGTRHIDSQVTNSHGQLLSMQWHLDKLSPGRIKDFCLGRRHQVLINEKIYDGCYSVGRGKLENINNFPDFIQIALNDLLPGYSFIKYLRLLKDNRLYISEEYRRTLQTNSSHVLFEDDTDYLKFGSIYCFINASNCKCQNTCNCQNIHYAIIQKIISLNSFRVQGDNDVNKCISYLHRCEKEDSFIIIPVQSILSICISIVIDQQLYLAVPINTKELE